MLEPIGEVVLNLLDLKIESSLSFDFESGFDDIGEGFVGPSDLTVQLFEIS